MYSTLDYTYRNADGSVSKVADSHHRIQTKGGRVIYDGSGIFPDIYTDPIHTAIYQSFVSQLLLL